jgi:hypothetical protein
MSDGLHQGPALAVMTRIRSRGNRATELRLVATFRAHRGGGRRRPNAWLNAGASGLPCRHEQPRTRDGAGAEAARERPAGRNRA